MDRIVQAVVVAQHAENCPLNRQRAQQSLRWTGGVIDWVELLYALHAIKCISDGNVSLKDLFRRMGEVFGFNVPEFANCFMSIKHRTDGHRTKFIDRMKDAVLEKNGCLRPEAGADNEKERKG